ncbi:hypothetical protein LVD13_07675 [Flavobacteriaceae bacterium D16]|nr:hypothetical protein [Flavobacteriaceae bacterium D16]
MRFNWISEKEIDDSLRKLCIDLEYRLRPRITRFLMDRLEYECEGDFSSFHFDVDLTSGKLFISGKTPLGLTQKIASDFQKEFSSFTFYKAKLSP